MGVAVNASTKQFGPDPRDRSITQGEKSAKGILHVLSPVALLALREEDIQGYREQALKERLSAQAPCKLVLCKTAELRCQASSRNDHEKSLLRYSNGDFFNSAAQQSGLPPKGTCETKIRKVHCQRKGHEEFLFSPKIPSNPFRLVPFERSGPEPWWTLW